jgi:hypothetical protein
MTSINPSKREDCKTEKGVIASLERYESPRLVKTGSLRNVLGKSAGGTELINRFRIAGHKV